MVSIRTVAAFAGGLLLLVAVVALVAIDDGDRAELLAGPVPDMHIPTAAATPRSAMPSSWLSASDEKSSPLLQDSSDNAVEVLSTPGADLDNTPAHAISLAAREPPAVKAVTAPSVAALMASASASLPAVPALVPPVASATAAGTLGADASQLSGLPKVSTWPHAQTSAQRKAATATPQARKKLLPLNQPPTLDRWKSMVRKAEEAANALAKEHPRSVLGAHWRQDVTGPTETLRDDSAAAVQVGKAAQDQLVQLAKDNLKQKGIYAPAAMCEKDNLPCPGSLQAEETSTGHYAPVRDNGPAPGEQIKAVQTGTKAGVVMPAPARYPAVSFYAQMREELSEKEKARLSAGASHRISLEMLAPGQSNRRPERDVKEHREREERRDEDRRRKEDELRRERLSRLSREQSRHGDEERASVRKREEGSARNINNHLYKMFSAPSKKSNRRQERLRESESETRPSADELKSRDSIRSIEGSKLYQEEMGDDEDPDEEERQKKLRGQLRIKQAQERMAVKWRQIMSHPPRRTAATRPDMLDPRELVS